MRPLALTSVFLLLPLLVAASAGEPGYVLEKTPDGYIRMDKRTGEMSICAERRGDLVCRMAADERMAMQDEMERLQGDVKMLEDRVSKLENSLAARVEQSLPTEEDFDRTMGYMERFFRRFMDIVKDFEKDGAKPLEPGSDRT